jgi:FlaA1/EpsC-like NDP-sugar epimerase
MILKMPRNWLKKLFDLRRRQKQFLMLIADCLLLPMAVWFSYAVRFGDWMPNLGSGVWLLIFAPIVSIPIFINFGFYRAVIRYIGSQAFMTVVKGATLSTLAMAMLVVLFRFDDVPRSLFLLYFGFVSVFVGGSRYLVRHYYYYALHVGEESIAVAIYGAGQTGIQLSGALAKSGIFAPIFFVDDNEALQNTVVQGLKVISPAELNKQIPMHSIQQILLALPSADNIRRKQIIQELEHYPVHVRSIPNLSDLVSGQRSLDELHEIDIEDLLGRAPVAPDNRLLSDCILNKNVIVTGAGGSIGKELCRQIFKQCPRLLVLFDISEIALYQIEREIEIIKNVQNKTIEIISILGSVQDKMHVQMILQKYKIDILFHAAAYKHVPLVESNPIEGVLNNCFGTLHTAMAAQEAGVRRFVLISTDKAVRPTSVMGASKRLAEMVLQAFSQTAGQTIFTMVRFGNVMGSSGSVIPLFRKQIDAGGPVTVTHPDVIRYFMTIPEAAQLVLQAGAYANGGEVFLLEMGEPIKILDLAKRMIRLSGYQIASNGSNGIAIEITGLRPGEKLFEELLISGDSKPTSHPRILQGIEKDVSWDELQSLLVQIKQICSNRDELALKDILKQNLEEFVS